MSPRTTTARRRPATAAVVAALALSGAAVAAPTAVASTTGPAASTTAAATRSAAPSSTPLSPEALARAVAPGQEDAVAAFLRTLGLGSLLDGVRTEALPGVLAGLEQLRQFLAPLKLPLAGSAVDTILRNVIDVIAGQTGVASPTTDSALEPPAPVSPVPGIADSSNTRPAAPAPVALPDLSPDRATVVRVSSTGSTKRLRIAAKCPSSSPVACTSAVSGTLGGRRAFGARRVTIDPGATREFTVALSRSTAKRLARSGATLRLRATTTGASPGVATKSVRVARTR